MTSQNKTAKECWLNVNVSPWGLSGIESTFRLMVFKVFRSVINVDKHKEVNTLDVNTFGTCLTCELTWTEFIATFRLLCA